MTAPKLTKVRCEVKPRTLRVTLIACNSKGQETSAIHLKLVVDVNAEDERNLFVGADVREQLLPDRHRRLAAYFMVKS